MSRKPAPIPVCPRKCKACSNACAKKPGHGGDHLCGTHILAV